MALETKQLHALSNVYLEAVYGGAKKEAPKDNRLVVTAADKKANTKAYQNYKAGNKAYKAADHLKTEDAKWGYDKDGNSLNPKDKKKKLKKEGFSNWRHDLKEIPDYEQIPVDAKKINAKVEEKNVKNKVKINPEMAEETQVDERWKGPEDIKADNRKWLDKRQKKIEQKHKEGKPVKPMKDYGESYEATKTKEVMGALKKRDLKTSVKKKIAADIVKKKGDTSKSDDRYAYESKLWDEVAANLTELGELNDATFKVEGYQRNPEKGEEESRKAKRERKGGYDEKREKRMSSPTRGINSPAFKEFMRSRGM